MLFSFDDVVKISDFGLGRSNQRESEDTLEIYEDDKNHRRRSEEEMEIDRNDQPLSDNKVVE